MLTERPQNDLVGKFVQRGCILLMYVILHGPMKVHLKYQLHYKHEIESIIISV